MFRSLVSVAVLSVSVFSLACATSGPRVGSNAERFLFVEGKAGRLRVSDGGTGGTPVVFVHGLGSDLEAWRAQLDHLRPTRRAIAYDQRGHGESNRACDGVYAMAALAEDLDAVVNAMSFDRVFLVGHSMSGQVLTIYAATHPEKVAGLVYADAIGDFGVVPRADLAAMVRRESAPEFGKAQQREFFSQMLGPQAQPSTRERVLASLDRLDPPAFAALRRSMADFEAGPLVKRYSGKRFSIEVEGNPWAGVLFSALDSSAPKKTIPAVSHWLMMDDPARFNNVLDSFIRP